MKLKSKIIAAMAGLLAFTFLNASQAADQSTSGETTPDLSLPKRDGVMPRNVVFILTDDHRYDAMGFLDHPVLKTPHMDALAKGGAYMKNAFVTTSLCSPSRASILTGQYMHNHRVVDNNNLAPKDTIFFPQYLDKAGYQTAYIGKWHMGGHSDEPRPGFDRWVSFRGQGRYYPNQGRSNWTLNVDGKRVPQKGYITDELTDYAVDWLNTIDKEQPFFMYLSHKAVHADFSPAERHRDLYKDAPLPPPKSQANSEENYQGKPRWVKDQRNSWHGVDFPYHSDLNVREYYRKYLQALAGVDDSIGRVMGWLKENELDQSTLVIYMGDNGFLFGEHGLIDKRNAYEESMRVPMLVHCPELIEGGSTIEGVVANIDIGPTALAAAGLSTPERMDGTSFLDLAAGKVKTEDWRDFLLYEYYWEYNFPHTPTMFALRGNQYKFISYHGVWDLDELYDLQADPDEMNNLMLDPKHQKKVTELRKKLWETMVSTGGDRIPLAPKRSHGASLRRKAGSEPSDFPPQWMRNKNGQD